MFERYTERARRVLFFARYEASQLGSISIETEHVLLGLLREGKGVTSRIFAGSRMSMEDIRREIEKGMTFHEKVPTSAEIPFTPECKRVLQLAAQEADRLLHNHVGTEHLLLGILREESCRAAMILTARGLQIGSVRDQIVALLQEPNADDRLPESIRAWKASATKNQSLERSLFEIRVSPARDASGQKFSGGPDHWTACGASLRTIVARLCNTSEVRVEIPSSIGDRQLYDCVVVLPKPNPLSELERVVREAIERAFDAHIVRETRMMDVYLLTTRPEGTSALRGSSGGGGGIMMSVHSDTAGLLGPGFSLEHAFRDASAVGGHIHSGGTIGELCQVLEGLLQRVLIDDTGLTDCYQVDVEVQAASVEAFLRAFAEQIGLRVTPARRDVEIVVVRPRSG